MAVKLRANVLTRETVSLAWLTELGACEGQRSLFTQLSGNDEVPITPELIDKAAHSGLDLDWAVERLLTATALNAYRKAKTTAWKAYEESISPTRKACQEATAPALKAYEEAEATALKAYEEAIAPTRKAYQEAIAPARKAYGEAKATALKSIIFE